MAVLLGGTLAGVLLLASVAGSGVLSAAVVAVLAVFALGVVRPARLPAAASAGWLALAVGAGAAVAVELTAAARLAPVLVALVPCLVAAILVQLARRDGRSRLTASLTFTVAACALAVLPVAWVGLRHATGGSASVALGLVGVLVTLLVSALPGPPGVVRTAGVLVAAVAGGALSIFVPAVQAAASPLSGVALAAFAGTLAAIALAVADRVAAETGEEPTWPGGAVGVLPVTVPLTVCLPLLAAAPVTYVLGRVLVG